MSELRGLSVVVPSYNGCALLRRTLRTLAGVAPDAEVIVVDGASSDGSPEMVASEFPAARLARVPNHGFAHATNRGLELATRDELLLLNSDLFLTREALDAMRARLRADAQLGAVAPVLLNEDGTRQHVFGATYWPNHVVLHAPTRVGLLSAACLLTRRDVLRAVGALDETFFLYNEEWDWCTRVRRAGYHLELVPEAVVHVGGGSTVRAPELLLEEQRGFLYYWHKHGPRPVLEALRLAMRVEGWTKSRIDPRPRHRAMWRALEALARDARYAESPFPVSGRGSAPAQPFWAPLELGVTAEAPKVTSSVTPPASEAPRARTLVPFRSRPRAADVLPFRPIKSAGARG